MAYSRRTVLAGVTAVGTATLAGCGGADAMRVTEQSSTSEAGTCDGDSRASVTTAADRTVVDVEGIVPASTPCNHVDPVVYTSRGEATDDEVILDIETLRRRPDACQPCDGLAYIPYTASVTFSRPVSYVKVFHVWGDDAGSIELARSQSTTE
jgi:hypothetical protein